MSRKTIFYILFFTVLVTGFYFVITRVIPQFGERRFEILNKVQPFSFVNQHGELVTEKDMRGKVYVAEYFFTTCKSICPIMNNNMKLIHEAYRNDTSFMILSHTSDPLTDDVARLRHYADSLQVNPDTWWFLTGRKDSLYSTARVSYLLDDPKNNVSKIDDQFIHTQYFALVDKQGRLRKKIYDGLKLKEVKELQADIAELLRESGESSNL